SDLKPIELNSASSSMADHRCDESSTGYSLTGCSPAEPVSASPIPHSLSLYPAAVHSSAANGYLSLFSLSQRKGAFQTELKSYFLYPEFMLAPESSFSALALCARLR
ncbi:MAG: hypothetical protein M3Y24_06430, partial [Acidobacteriota bacterium]|nr:hypothetical protein [Acidobacteriota bacterium]